MKTVEQLLQAKPAGIIGISPQASVLDALKLLAEQNVGAVLVMEGPRLAGIMSERDYARKVALKGRSSQDTAVADVMTREVICVNLTNTNEDCMALMTQRHIRHLPVMGGAHGEEVVGMLSIGDLVKALISEQQFIISQLESYIHG
jgi:CBS domain-containing protein